MRQEMAERRAIEIVSWLLAEDELLPVFMGATGVSESDFRSRVGEADFLASVLDFVLLDDAWVMSCCNAIGEAPEALLQIRAALPGGDLPNWT